MSNLAFAKTDEQTKYRPLSLNSSVAFNDYEIKEESTSEDSTHDSQFTGVSNQTRNFSDQRATLEFVKEALGNIANYERKLRSSLISQLTHEIRSIIQQDEFIDGEISHAELYMKEICTNYPIEYILKALMQIYSSNLRDPHILEGVLVMISCVPYEAVEPDGQIMAMGLLSNKELIIRDRAIQCFERWNSKKGVPVLKSLNCHPKWLQNYVEKVIMYLERDGTD